MGQLITFDGGLNTRKATHLLNANEAQMCTNVDTSAMSLRAVLGDTDENIDIQKYIYNFNDSWVSSNESRTYQEFKEKLYYSNSLDIPKKSSDGISWNNLGIKGPDNAPEVLVSTVGYISGAIQYCYTYYNRDDGSESVPSSYSSEVEAENNNINITVKASADPQVTNIKLYRLGGNITEMQLVDTLGNEDTTYNDNYPDLDIDGSVLDSYNNGQAPEGLSYLTEHNAMFFGSVGDKLWYSDIAFVNNWSPFNFIDFDDIITGIGPTSNGLLVFTKFKTYIITGTSPNTLSKYLLNSSQGCISHKSVKFIRNTLIWLSTDGVCISNGGEIDVISRDKLSKETLSNNGVFEDSSVHDDIYYLGYNDRMLIVDFRFGVTFRYLDILVDSLHKYNDILYYSKSGRLYSLGTSNSYSSLSYKSPKLAEGQISNLKSYKHIYVRCLGELRVLVFINSVLVASKNIDKTTSEILIPQRLRTGYCIEFEVYGTGELLELQYVVEGRQNGK